MSASHTVVGLIFTAVFVAEVSNKLPEKMTSLVIPAVTEAGLSSSSVSDLLTAIGRGSRHAFAAVPDMTESMISITNTKVSDAYAASYAYPAYTAMALGVAALVLAILIRDFDHYLSDHVSSQIYHKSDIRQDILEDSHSSLDEQPHAVEGAQGSTAEPGDPGGIDHKEQQDLDGRLCAQ